MENEEQILTIHNWRAFHDKSKGNHLRVKFFFYIFAQHHHSFV